IVPAIRVRFCLRLISKERVGAEWLPVVRRAAILIHLGLAAVIADCGPVLRAAAITKCDSLDLQRLEPQPGGDVIGVAWRVRGAARQKALRGLLGIWTGVPDLPYEGIRRIIHQAPPKRIADLLLVIGRHQRAIRTV